ncbi:hypothetical protein [Cellulomonas endophytica]|uniref:hypothetical protein n=1 Tax=Cellulomonas endophytica TaxID=2494735 RepID=UPI00101147F7|nr:hypothetical protein [Cellulomonas endophytica]
MDAEIQLVRDDDGVAVIGDGAAVEAFIDSHGWASRDLGLSRLGKASAVVGAVAQAGGVMAENSGRWVKLTKESAELAKKLQLMSGSESGVVRAILTDKGQIKHVLEFAKAPGALALNPAALTSVGGLMTQMAMQQAMDEVNDYLATIDEKVDDILRGQKDAVLADMIGVELVIDEAMAIREAVGGVSDVTWSKVQDASGTIARTQGYALRQLDGIAQRMEGKEKVGELVKSGGDAEASVQEWLAVLARCFQLQDAVSVLELDRVLGSSAADELERHRVGVRTARAKRLAVIEQTTQRLLSRIDAAAGTANAKVLLHPGKSHVVVRTSNRIGDSVVALHEALGITDGRESVEARRWRDAAAEMRDDALDRGADGFDAAKNLGAEALGRARAVGGKASSGIGARLTRLRDKGKAPDLGNES